MHITHEQYVGVMCLKKKKKTTPEPSVLPTRRRHRLTRQNLQKTCEDVSLSSALNVNGKGTTQRMVAFPEWCGDQVLWHMRWSLRQHRQRCFRPEPRYKCTSNEIAPRVVVKYVYSGGFFAQHRSHLRSSTPVLLRSCSGGSSCGMRRDE